MLLMYNVLGSCADENTIVVSDASSLNNFIGCDFIIIYFEFVTYSPIYWSPSFKHYNSK